MSNDNKEFITKKSKNVYYPYVIFSGLVAGTAEVSINHPLWVIKTRMQIGDINPWAIRGIYNGLSSNIVSMAPLIASRLFLATYFKSVFFSSQNKIENYQLIIAGLSGGSMPSLISGPLELIRTKQIAVKANFTSTVNRIVKCRGFSALFSGTPGTAARDALYTIGFFGLYPALKEEMNAQFPSDPAVNAALSKPLAGAVAAFSSQPLDTIKIYQQINCEKKSISIAEALKNIIARDGFKGFFLGATPRILRVISAVSIIATVDENVTNYLEKNRCRFEV